ncbi:hypothetical protein C8J56DRAFT_1047713 [Mycena floridula]|nr:hypothetical protein C8J56DRAFT_1047713 [Mycena floridula]
MSKFFPELFLENLAWAPAETDHSGLPSMLEVSSLYNPKAQDEDFDTRDIEYNSDGNEFSGREIRDDCIKETTNTLCLAFSASVIQFSSGLFFAFVLLNAGCGAYLETASRFGPTAMQTIMSGQAAVAVTVSSVQVVSAIAST